MPLSLRKPPPNSLRTRTSTLVHGLVEDTSHGCRPASPPSPGLLTFSHTVRVQHTHLVGRDYFLSRTNIHPKHHPALPSHRGLRVDPGKEHEKRGVGIVTDHASPREEGVLVCPHSPGPWESAPPSAPPDGCQAPGESGLETPHRTTRSGTPLSHRVCSLKTQELTGSPGQGPRLHLCQGLVRCRASGHGHGSQAQGSGAREPGERPGDDATFGL